MQATVQQPQRAPHSGPVHYERHRPELTSTQPMRSCTDDPKKASAKVGRCFRRVHAHGLIAKIPRTRRRRVTNYGRKVMGTSM